MELRARAYQVQENEVKVYASIAVDAEQRFAGSQSLTFRWFWTSSSWGMYIGYVGNTSWNIYDWPEPWSNPQVFPRISVWSSMSLVPCSCRRCWKIKKRVNWVFWISLCIAVAPWSIAYLQRTLDKGLRQIDHKLTEDVGRNVTRCWFQRLFLVHEPNWDCDLHCLSWFWVWSDYHRIGSNDTLQDTLDGILWFLWQNHDIFVNHSLQQIHWNPLKSIENTNQTWFQHFFFFHDVFLSL